MASETEQETWKYDESDKRPECKYGKGCYRKNPDHQKNYKHPIKVKRKSTEPCDTQPKKKTKIEDFFGGGKKTTPKEVNKEDSVDKKEVGEDAEEDENSPRREDEEEISVPVESSGYVRSSEQDNVSDEEEGPKGEEENPSSPTDVRQSIKEKFLVEMPEDFYNFWEFCNSFGSSKPQDALKTTLELQLVGPFDILAGKKKKKGSKPNYLRHWRYFYDPPEFQTIRRGDDSTQFHMGYFRDDPHELPVFVASNTDKNCSITPRAQTVFGAVKWFAEKQVKKEKSKAKQDKIKEVVKKLRAFAEAKNISLEENSSSMKERKKKVVCKTFHGAGLVVPVDENDVGYREVPETAADLKKMFKKVVESASDEERDKNFEPVQELITLVQFANDECDYGEGLELGMAMFCYGAKILHKTSQFLLSMAYELLHRDEFAQILRGHLEDRRDTTNLSQLD